MSKLVRQQKAEMRRQAARIELEKMRAHLKGKRQTLRVIEAEEIAYTKARKEERRARLRHIKKELRGAPKLNATSRRRKLEVIRAKRKAFVEWWATVRAERARRLDEIRKLREELKDWTENGPARRKVAIEAVMIAATRSLDQFDAQTSRDLEQLARAIQQARAELKSDEYDLRSWASNRRRDAKPIVVKKPKGESVRERNDFIEQNLRTPEGWAWWRAGKAVILRDAKAAGITEPDAIAEMVEERAELDPDRALEYMQQDSDAWVEAEARKQGFAA